MATRHPFLLTVTNHAGHCFGRFRILPGERVVVGRGPQAELRLGDFSCLSHPHCSFAHMHGQLVVEDLHSRSGTYTDNGRVNGPTPVEVGSRILAGRACFIARADVELPFEATRDYLLFGPSWPGQTIQLGPGNSMIIGQRVQNSHRIRLDHTVEGKLIVTDLTGRGVAVNETCQPQAELAIGDVIGSPRSGIRFTVDRAYEAKDPLKVEALQQELARERSEAASLAKEAEAGGEARRPASDLDPARQSCGSHARLRAGQLVAIVLTALLVLTLALLLAHQASADEVHMADGRVQKDFDKMLAAFKVTAK